MISIKISDQELSQGNITFVIMRETKKQHKSTLKIGRKMNLDKWIRK